MKTALVTGSAGFIGSQVVRTFRRQGYVVYRVDIAGPDRRDARDYLRQAMFQPDVVVHCAAAVVTTAAKASARVAVAENLEIDAALFQWAARAKPGRLVYFSSSCAYPAHAHNRGTRWQERAVSLTQPEMPDGLYGWAKLTGELLAAELAAEGTPVTVVRPFSVYGPGVRTGFAVRGFAEQIARRADPVEIWGDDRQTRDYIHVSDVAAAVLAAVREGVDGPVNLGTGRATSLHDLAVMMAGIAGYQPQIKVAEDMPAGVPWLVANPARLRSFYEPRVSLETGLAEVLAQ
jgi:nucleoside-diphosphate-sugar epimerase